MIKTFRGQLTDNAVDHIRLSTNNGLTGYKIIKFQIIPVVPGGVSLEAIVKLFTTERTVATDTIEFNDPTLLGCAYYQDNDATHYPSSMDIIFDGMIFNQDIYITHADKAGSAEINYYLELEQVKLDLNEATVATLKDMRGRE